MARRRLIDTEETAADFAPSLPAKNPGLKAFADIAKAAKGFRPARETLRRVRAVPTIFPGFDRITRVAGWPVDRVAVVHGPSGDGKTYFAHGVGLSFLRRQHAYFLVDAEMTTPITWCETLMGGYADGGGFFASRPRSYEEAVDDVRRMANGIAEKREKKLLAPDTSALFVIDSIRKLVPEDIQSRIKKMGAEGEKGSIDGYGGRAAQLRAALNAAWMDELVPLMYHTGCAIMFIARESEDPNADPRAKQFGNDFKVGGGKSVIYESSLRIRIKLDRFVYEGGNRETGERGDCVGERHQVEIHKTKVSARQDRIERAYFHTSNGSKYPEGFDRARDVLEVADQTEVVKRAGSWLSFEGRRWQGETKFFQTVTPDVLDAMEGAARSKFEPAPKEEP